MGEDLNGSSRLEVDNVELFGDYALVWKVVSEIYILLKLGPEVMGYGKDFAAIQILRNPELFEEFKGLKSDQYSAEVKEKIIGALLQPVPPNNSQGKLSN